jgi:hypothetical protein
VTPEYAVAITHVLGLLCGLVEAGQEAKVKNAITADKLANLLLHSCVNVRTEVVRLFGLFLDNYAQPDPWMGERDLRHGLDNLCEIIRSEPTDEVTDCLASLTLTVITALTSAEAEKLLKALLKKTRGFYTHEKINETKEWSRRLLYYNFVTKVLKKLDVDLKNEKAVTFVNMMRKNVIKDRRQPQLEELAACVQELCEKWPQQRPPAQT